MLRFCVFTVFNTLTCRLLLFQVSSSSADDSSPSQCQMSLLLSEAFQAMRAELDSLPLGSPSMQALEGGLAGVGEVKTVALLEEYSLLLLQAVNRKINTSTWAASTSNIKLKLLFSPYFWISYSFFLILPSLTLFSEPYSCSLTQHFTSSFILRSFFPWTFSVFLSHWKHTGGQRGAQFLHLFTRRPEEMGPEGLSLCEWQLYLLISSCPQKQCQAIFWTHF